MKKIIIITFLLILKTSFASSTIESTLDASKQTWFKFAIMAEDMTTDTKDLLDGKIDSEIVSVLCYEGAVATSDIDQLQSYLNELDKQEEMLFNYPQRDKYLLFRNDLEKYDDIFGLSECKKLIDAQSATEVKELAQEMHEVYSSVRKKYGYGAVASLLESYFKFAGNWENK